MAKNKVWILIIVLVFSFLGFGKAEGMTCDPSLYCTGSPSGNTADAERCASLAEQQGRARGYDISCEVKMLWFPGGNPIDGSDWIPSPVCNVNGSSGHAAWALAGYCWEKGSGFEGDDPIDPQVAPGWDILAVELKRAGSGIEDKCRVEDRNVMYDNATGEYYCGFKQRPVNIKLSGKENGYGPNIFNNVGYAQGDKNLCYNYGMKSLMYYEKPVSVSINTQLNSPIYYTLDGTRPTQSSSVYSGPIAVNENTCVVAVSFDQSVDPRAKEGGLQDPIAVSGVVIGVPQTGSSTGTPVQGGGATSGGTTSSGYSSTDYNKILQQYSNILSNVVQMYRGFLNSVPRMNP